ncbi:MAG: uridine kinase [Flavobacteriaceae bacterium]|nr:uridine kinase [Flavobacteriaceae bacterium]
MPLIGICGGTASGKSTLANKIKSSFSKIGVVCIVSDSYYKDHSLLNFKERSKINFDHPNSIDFDLIIKNLKKIKNNKKIKEPIYSYKTHKRLKKTNIVLPQKIVIVEGLHIYCNDKLLELLDFKIFLDLDSITRLRRRIERDVKERNRSVEEVKKRYFDMTEPMYEKFILPSKNKSDLIINANNLNLKKIIKKIDELL